MKNENLSNSDEKNKIQSAVSINGTNSNPEENFTNEIGSYDKNIQSKEVNANHEENQGGDNNSSNENNHQIVINTSNENEHNQNVIISPSESNIRNNIMNSTSPTENNVLNSTIQNDHQQIVINSTNENNPQQTVINSSNLKETSKESHSNPTNVNIPHEKSAITNPDKDITIKPEESKDNFGDELFEQLILNFVEKDYEEKRTQIEEALAANNGEKLYFIVHSFKTTARMLCIEDFAQECQEIQDYSSKGKEDWEKLKTLVPLFLADFERVYQDAKAIYEKDYKPAEQEILPEFANSPFFPKSELAYLHDIPSQKNSSKSLRRDDSFGFIDSKDKNDSSRDPLRSIESVGKFKPPKSRDSEFVDKVLGLDETEKIFPIPKFNEPRKANPASKANSKVNVKSMRSLENISSSKQFFSTQNITSGGTNIKSEEFEEKNLNDISDLHKDSDLSETPTSLPRMMTGSEGSKVAPHFNVNPLMTPISLIGDNFKETKKENSANQSVSSHGNFQFSNQFATASSNNFNLPNYNSTRPSTSPLLAKRKLNVPATKQINIIPVEDAIFAELKPIRFDGLYKKNYNQEELIEELRKIEAFSQEREINAGRKAVGSSRNLKTGIANDNIMTDNAYPFKQDTFKFNCMIF